MNRLRVRLMRQEAMRRLEDAKILSNSMGLDEQSNSPYLLRLLALELLLKIVFESVLGKPAHGHRYDELFAELPENLRMRILLEANERVGVSALLDNHASVLKEFGQNFIALRYPWERYANLSEDQYSCIGNEWLVKGAPLEEATFRYYPEELVGVLAALLVIADELSIGAN